jgi:hypothetical protein
LNEHTQIIQETCSLSQKNTAGSERYYIWTIWVYTNPCGPIWVGRESGPKSEEH